MVLTRGEDTDSLTVRGTCLGANTCLSHIAMQDLRSYASAEDVCACAEKTRSMSSGVGVRSLAHYVNKVCVDKSRTCRDVKARRAGTAQLERLRRWDQEYHGSCCGLGATAVVAVGVRVEKSWLGSS